MVLGLEKSLALLLVATHTSLATQDVQYFDEHNSLQIMPLFIHSSCKRRLEKDRIIKTQSTVGGSFTSFCLKEL